MSLRRYDITVGEYLADRKIEAIKRLRRIFGYGLKEAKDKVDGMCNGHSATSFLLNDEQIEELIAQGFIAYKSRTANGINVYIEENQRKIEVIKRFRQATRWGLKESKDAIDEMWKHNRPVNIGKVSEYSVVMLREAGFTVTGWIDDHFDSELFEI